VNNVSVLLNTSSWAVRSGNPFIAWLMEYWGLEVFIQILPMAIQLPFRILKDV